MTLSTEFERLELPLAKPLGISRGTTETAENVLVCIADDAGNVGVGAAAPTEYYSETTGDALAALPDLLVAVEDVNDPHAQQRVERRLRESFPDTPAARAAVSVALADLAATRQAEPLYRRLGLDPDATPPTSYTVGIDTPERMAKKAVAAREAGYPILKLKVGTDDDRARVRAVREGAPEARLRVDANGAWEPADTIRASRWLAEQGVEFVEQPVSADNIDGLRAVREDGALPVAADESCVTASDVPRVADAVDIVVTKLEKSGGLHAAIEQTAAAHAHALEVMLGCMVASNAAIAGACHLAPLVEFADLDGALLLASDPYDGVAMPDSRVNLEAVESGTGVTPN